MINLYSTTQCFNHFKCMICQVEIHARQPMIFHAKTKIHKKNRKLYSVVEKATILEKLLEATQKDKEERSSSSHVFTNFPNTNLRIFCFQMFCNICFDFLKSSKLRKNQLFWPIRKLFIFSTGELVKKFVDL